MLNEIHIFDDIIPTQLQDEIEKSLLLVQTSLWTLVTDMGVYDRVERHKTPGVGLFFYDDKKDLTDHYHKLILQQTLPIVIESCKKLNISTYSVTQGRSFVYFPLAQECRKVYDTPHVDSPHEHIVCLYYVNDSDGDTYLFNETTDDYAYNGQHTGLTNDEKVTVMQRVSPKKGRVVLFDGKRYHSSSGPSKDLRCVVNYNIVV